MAGGPMEAHSRGTVIDILTTALAGPAIDTHTAVATQSVEAGAPIVASVGLQLTFIHILRAELACGTQTQQSTPAAHPPKVCHLALFSPAAHLSIQEGTGSCRCSRHPHMSPHLDTGALDSRPH